MVDVKIESPISYKKKEEKLTIKTDRLSPNQCMVVDAWDWKDLKTNKFLVCMGKNPGEVSIKPIREE